MRRIRCLLGLHDWKPNRFNGRFFVLGDAPQPRGGAYSCRRCGKTAWRSPSRAREVLASIPAVQWLVLPLATLFVLIVLFA